MNITFFIRSKNGAVSIDKHFSPLISKIGETEQIKKYYMPKHGFNLSSVLQNIYFTFKHRNISGINHITGDCHYIIIGLIGCKTVLTIHDLGFYVSHKKEMNFLKRILLYYLQIYIPIRLASRVIAITEKTKNEIKEVIPFNKTIYTAKHVNIDRFKYTPKDLNKLNTEIFQNGTAPNKNLETTIKAVSNLGLKLHILRRMSPDQIKLANTLKLKYINDFDITDEELLQAYIKSDIVCMPSLYEGFGAMLVEAQAVGRPVITTDIEPMRSISGGAALLLKNPQDVYEMERAILKIINDDEFRNDLILKGRKNADLYSLKNCSDEYIRIYNTIN